MNETLKVCCCCAQEDQPLLLKLRKHLVSLEREGLIMLWDETEIKSGAEWKDEIHTHFNHAQIILLLLSSDFMASKLYNDSEVCYAMERHKHGLAHIIPIILRPVDWEKSPVGMLAPLPTGARPVISPNWTEDEAFLNIAKGIRRTAEELIREAEDRELARSTQEEPTHKATETEQVQAPHEEFQKALLLNKRSDETCEEGLIIWDKKQEHYIIQLASSQLKLKRDLLGDLLPGPYRFRYLAQAGIVLSEEPISNAPLVAAYLSQDVGSTYEEQSLQIHQQALCDLFQFSLDDLHCNQQEAISKEQIQRLTEQGQTIIALIVLIGSGASVAGEAIGHPSLWFLWLLLGIFFCLSVLALWFSGREQKQSIADLLLSRVEYIDGYVKLVARTRSMDIDKNVITDYYYTIGGQLFPVPKSAHKVLFRAIRYRIFYIRKKQEIYPQMLSIEPLEAPRH